jgi:meso-butanediol dehydrogenase/(S,S)-butanediol dehydrogenase/diacetyl reductase
MAGRVAGKVCVVTGGAQGIGSGIVRGLAREGASVVIADLDSDRAEALARELDPSGSTIASFQVDVADRAQVGACLDFAIDTFGSLDVVFNNAGFNKPMKFLEVTEDNWNAIQRVNGWAVLMNTQEAARRMIAQGKGGKIINTASIAGRQGFPDITPYCAAKAGCIIITQSAAKELAPHGITVNAFAPGVVATPLWENLNKDLHAIGAATAPDTAMNEFAAGILVGRPAVPEDLAGLGIWLASSETDYLTGQVIMFDGGMILV